MSSINKLDGEPSLTFVKTLCGIGLLLVVSNIYTLNLLWNVDQNQQFIQISSEPNNINFRRSLLSETQDADASNPYSNIFSLDNSNNGNNKQKYNEIKDHFRIILDANDEDMFNKIHNDSDADAKEFEKAAKEAGRSVVKTNNNNNNNNDNINEFYSTIKDEWIMCDWSIEYLFNHSINLLYSMKSKNYIEIMNCPEDVKIGRRVSGYVPFIFGNLCESWWHRDAVFIISHLLNKNMKALEYGSGGSTIFISHFVGYIIGIEHTPDWYYGMLNLTKFLQINNIEIRKFPVHIPYVEIDFRDNPGGFDWSLETGGGIDFISVDGRVRIHCMRWAIKKIKQHGGILLLDNSDRPGDDGINATKIVPKHWLRYDSYNLPQHLKELPSPRWLKNSRTTIWITRYPKCYKNDRNA